MADKKISGLNPIDLPINDADLVPIVQGGETKKSTWLNIKNYFANLFILRSGTTAGNPITGNVEINELDKGIWGKGANYPDDFYGIQISSSGVANYYKGISTDATVTVNIGSDGVFINGTIDGNNVGTLRGLIGEQDFTPNITDLDYTQKKYVDTKAPLTPRVQSITSSATVTPTSTNDLVTITAQAVALTLANPSGTFAEGQALMIRIKDNGTARAITFGSNYRAIGVTLPTTTIANKILYLGIIYDSIDAKWNILGTPQQA